MFTPNFIKNIQGLVAKGQTKKAIQQLNKSPVIPQYPELQQHLILLTSQWHRYQKDQLEDIKSDRKLKKELNRINKAILFLLEGNFSAMEAVTSSKKKIPIWKQYRITMKSLNVLFPTLFAFLVFEVIYGGLTFGYGLGDVYYLLFFGFLTLPLLIFSIIERNHAKKLFILNMLWLLLLLILLLMLSVWRGPEYGWNGHIFHSD